ncbi:hypothetical protein MTO96_010490 [Rhipicephalus appendiculatus]
MPSAAKVEDEERRTSSRPSVGDTAEEEAATSAKRESEPPRAARKGSRVARAGRHRDRLCPPAAQQPVVASDRLRGRRFGDPSRARSADAAPCPGWPETAGSPSTSAVASRRRCFFSCRARSRSAVYVHPIYSYRMAAEACPSPSPPRTSFDARIDDRAYVVRSSSNDLVL